MYFILYVKIKRLKIDFRFNTALTTIKIKLIIYKNVFVDNNRRNIPRSVDIAPASARLRSLFV